MTDKFFNKYEMRVLPSQRRLHRIPQNKVNAWNIEMSVEMLYDLHTEEVECVDVVMPKDRLEELEKILEWYEDREQQLKNGDDLRQRFRDDARVRIENPSVDRAYQKYMLLLEMARK